MERRLATTALAGWLAACGGSPPAVAGSPQPDPGPRVPVAAVAAAMTALLATPDGTPGTPTTIERTALASLYGQDVTPAWLDGGGRLTQDARIALAIIEDAASDGLRPADYGAADLAHLELAIDAVDVPPVRDLAAFDLQLSLGMLRFWRHLHEGRVDPRAIGFKMSVPADNHDFAGALREALDDHELQEATERFRPPLVLYRSLRRALAEYRARAEAPAFEKLPEPAKSVKPGDSYPYLAELARQLVTLGDLGSEVPVPALYEGAIVDGVRRFQDRHGLEPDGVLGRGTLAALNVPMAERVVQIELALERLRWMPHLSTDRFLAVNIPMFQLWGWDGVPPDGTPTFGMRVIVGRALSTETPVFAEEMRHVIFRPYWNVPPSILRGEIIPALRRDPRYLEKHDMEIVAGQGDRSPVVPATPENIARLGSGSLRVRQRPGPSNSLGLVKFVFPNDDNIYMHGTPAPQLFGRPRRDFSHGCIRVQDPVRLAEWVLAGEPEWTRERIVGAMNGTSPRQVNLARPIQVVLFYITAVVMPGDGTVRFAEDIYRHDARLRKALAGRTS